MSAPMVFVGVLLNLFLAVAAYRQHNTQNKGGTCERITVPLCSDVLYNYTRLPNMLGHTTQDKVRLDLTHFEPLVHTSCSPHVKFFVCSIYTPMCTDTVNVPITSCRTVCEEVKRGCLKILNNFGLTWPKILNCSKFPSAGSLCMQPTGGFVEPAVGIPGGAEPPRRQFARCPADMVDLDPSDGDAPCAARCSAALLYSRDDRAFAESWMLVWASVCLVATGLVVGTCALDRARFKYPERAIIHLAACYHVCAWAYVARCIIGYDEVACDQLKGGPPHLVTGSLDNKKCAIIFMTVYFFSMAASLWWVILTFACFLSASKKWSSEAIDSWSSYFHVFAWGVPALFGLPVLVWHKVDASELTGLCSVGNGDPAALTAFVIGPAVCFLLVGCLFILAGFVAMVRVRSVLRLQGAVDVAKLEKLMAKVGIFSLLYIIPSICVVGCDVYHVLQLLDWRPVTTDCKMQRVDSDSATCDRPEQRPRVELYILKIFMSLIVGTTSSMWVGGRKCCSTWQRFFCCGLLRAADTKTPAVAVPLVERAASDGAYPVRSRMGVAVPSGSSCGSGGRPFLYQPAPPAVRYFRGATTGSSEASKV